MGVELAVLADALAILATVIVALALADLLAATQGQERKNDGD
jgi:hypothetical protein